MRKGVDGGEDEIVEDSTKKTITMSPADTEKQKSLVKEKPPKAATSPVGHKKKNGISTKRRKTKISPPITTAFTYFATRTVNNVIKTKLLEEQTSTGVAEGAFLEKMNNNTNNSTLTVMQYF